MLETRHQEWMDFVADCRACTACGLAERRKHVVVWRGAVPAPVMMIGEGPGADEDRLGEPFVGRSGALLDTLMTAFDLNMDTVHIANVVKCRPPGNRDPHPEEIAACRALLDEQMRWVKPQMIILLGSVAYRWFTGEFHAISKMRGRFFEYEGCPVMPTFHPAYVLRSPGQRKYLWADIGMARRRLEEMGVLPPLTGTDHPVDLSWPEGR